MSDLCPRRHKTANTLLVMEGLEVQAQDKRPDAFPNDMESSSTVLESYVTEIPSVPSTSLFPSEAGDTQSVLQSTTPKAVLLFSLSGPILGSLAVAVLFILGMHRSCVHV